MALVWNSTSNQKSHVGLWIWTLEHLRFAHHIWARAFVQMSSFSAHYSLRFLFLDDERNLIWSRAVAVRFVRSVTLFSSPWLSRVVIWPFFTGFPDEAFLYSVTACLCFVHHFVQNSQEILTSAHLTLTTMPWSDESLNLYQHDVMHCTCSQVI